MRARDLGIGVGEMEPGPLNAITDIAGVKVGHRTIINGDDVRTGVTAVLPHEKNVFREKTPAAVYVGNGYGKMAGSTQIEELGTIEAPIILTNTLGVGTAITAVIKHILGLPGNEAVESVNAVVGETNDGYLNDIRGFHVTEEDVHAAINAARTGPVPEGCVGAGTGTRVFGFKGGIGTSSRIVQTGNSGSYLLGVLVQTNFGGLLEINGVPVGRELKRQSKELRDTGDDGSCVIVVATDAPLCPRNLKRIAARTMHGLARTGAYMSNGSGDYAICFSTAYRIPHGKREPIKLPPLMPNDATTPFFRAAIEATQEAVYNSLFMAETTSGRGGRVVEAIPIDDVRRIYASYRG